MHFYVTIAIMTAEIGLSRLYFQTNYLGLNDKRGFPELDRKRSQERI